MHVHLGAKQNYLVTSKLELHCREKQIIIKNFHDYTEHYVTKLVVIMQHKQRSIGYAKTMHLIEHYCVSNYSKQHVQEPN